MYFESTKFEPLYQLLHSALLEEGRHVDTGRWQALKNVPHTKTVELRGVTMQLPIDTGFEEWGANVSPNMPWAEDHFAERVSGAPLNPGEQYKNWPWYRGGVEDHKGDGTFSHTYMERLWPTEIPHPHGIAGHRDMLGIRYPYGDLSHVVDLLWREPYTRQAYVPIWFPEDTGARAEQRVPCTLGYHLMLREGQLHCYYPMRSLDFLRYFRDDAYMAGRLVQWVIAELKACDSYDQSVWQSVVPGDLTMFAHSLHVFEGDLPKLRREAKSSGEECPGCGSHGRKHHRGCPILTRKATA